MSLIPIIQIDSSKARNLDISIDLQKIYYQPSGYQRTAKKLHEASLKAGFDFSLNEVRDWIERQAVHQVHMPRPRYIPRASFSSITTPNEVHQADVLYTRHIKSKRTIYLFYLNLVDVASRYKASVPIGVTLRGPAQSIKNMQGILTSSTIAKCLVKIYDNPENPLIWPKVFLSDRGSEFKGDCEKILRKHGVKIQKAYSKNTMGIVERYNRTFTEIFYRILDGKDLLITFPRPLDSIQYESLETLIKDLPNVITTIVKDINNSITRHLGISPAEAIKRKSIISKSSYPRDGPVGFDEEKLSGDVLVRYLLYSSDQEGGRRRAGDLNWSSHIYHIRQSMVQKNQPVLYWLEEVPFGLIDNDDYILKRPKRSFVREELQIIKDVQLPPQWVLTN